jgi:hypothetical protein
VGDLSAVERHYSEKLLALRSKTRSGTISIAFLVADNRKWNGDSLYKEFAADDRFSLQIVIAADQCENKQANIDFFEQLGHKYSVVENGKQLREIKPDIVFYQEPWIANKDYRPRKISEYALCLYFPYGIATTIERAGTWMAAVHFFKTIYMQFVFSDDVVALFASKGVANTVATGHPKLDVYSQPIKTNPWQDENKLKIIFAPHHSFPPSSLCWATFDWSGPYLLNYAQSKPVTEFIFKPHPYFQDHYAKYINDKPKAAKVYSDWAQAGVIYDKGDYFDLFRTADLLITDCGSFLTEWLPTKKPCIHLISENSVARSFVHERNSAHYYKCKNAEELDTILDMLIVKQEDPLAAEREKDAQTIPLGNSAKNIFSWLKNLLELK